MIEDTPQELIHDLLTQAVFGNHPLGRPVLGERGGDRQRLPTLDRRLPPRALRARQRRRRRGRESRARAASSRSSRAWRRRSARPDGARAARAPWVSAPPPRLAFQRKDTEQYHLCLGAPGISRSDKRRFAASILDGILGGSASSRLFQEIREKRGLAYTVYTFSSQYADTGQIGVYVGTRAENLGACLEIVARADRGRRGRRCHRGRARPREGEPQGPDHALDGDDVEPHEPAREVGHHRQRAPRPRPHPRPRSTQSTRRASPSSTGALLARERLVRRGGGAEREARAQSRRAGLSRPHLGRGGVKVLLYGADGKVGSALTPKLGGAQGTRLRRPDSGDQPRRDGHDAAIDFTRPDAVRKNVEGCLQAGIPCVVGTTGMGPADLASFDELARRRDIACFVAPNFAVGAVLMMRFAAEAAKYLPRGEIVELHHETKVDAPSGTAKATAEAMPGDVPIHSVRLPGPHRASGSPPRGRRGAPDDPSRHSFSGGVRAGSAARAGQAVEPSAGRHRRARKSPGVRFKWCSAKS